MKHTLPERRDPYKMRDDALARGWQSVDTIPLKGEGPFLVLTMSGLVRLARNQKAFRRVRAADGYGPTRTMVVSVETTNYLAAIAWKPAETSD